jgi:hypothetical protein
VAERIGFVPQRTMEDAVRDLCRAFKDQKFPNSMNDDRYINVKMIQKKAA